MSNTSDKPKKKQGPIRWGAVVPSVVLTALLVTYFSYFFDGHLRRGLEYAGTHINGAEVDIGHLRTHFLGASLEIGDIQVTDKNQPERNILQVGKIRFKMLWDALLRAKLVVEEASILNIQALTPRRQRGYVVPPSPPSQGPSALEKVQSQVLDQTRKKFNENFLGDVAGLLAGGDYKDQLKTFESSLKSEARIKELDKELKNKKTAWEQRIKDLPQAQDFKSYQDRIKALKFDFNKPAELAKSVQEADKIRKEIEAKVKTIDQTSKEVASEIRNFNQQFKDLEKLANEDMHDLQARLKLPNVDAKEFSQQLFLTMIEKKLGGLAKYIEVGRKYMPTKKAAGQPSGHQEEALIPRKRGQGHTYRFPVTTGYPMLWLKHAAISSELGQSEYSGNINGEIKDLNSDPAFLGRPTLILVKGDFPKQGISGLDAKITLDHTTEQAKDSLDVSIASFPVDQNVLASSPDLRLALASAKGASQMNAVLVDSALNVVMKNSFSQIQYDLTAKNPTAKELIESILKGIPVVSINAEVKGSLSQFDVHINSNLGDELSKGFQKQLQARIEGAKAQLNKIISDRIGGDKDKLKQEIEKATGPLTKGLEAKKAEAGKAIEDAKKQAEGGQKQGPGKKLEEEGKKLLKKFGF